MLQGNQKYIYTEEKDNDTPLEGHKSCRSEAYADDFYERSENPRDEVKIVLKPLF